MTQDFVATLVAGAGRELSFSFLDKICGHLEKAGYANLSKAWLDQPAAADLFFTGAAIPALSLESLPVDCIVQPLKNRRKKLLLADMESTIIEQEMLDELADAVGLRDKIAGITARAMNGELDFPSALRERVALLRGLPVCVLDDVAQRITLMPGAESLLKQMKAAGAKAWLVSGGFTCFAKPIAERLGFDKIFANDLVIRDGMIAGEVLEPYLDKNSKKTLLMQAISDYGLTLADTVTVGDGANDIPMLSACNEGGGMGVAYHAKPNVRSVIANQINHGDLRTLLYAQGYGQAA